jgi:hypothetical protein
MREILAARKYYRRKASGYILLVNGQPYWFSRLADIPSSYK